MTDIIKAASDIDRILAALNRPKPPVNRLLEYFQEIADSQAIAAGKPYVVIGDHGHWQVWPRWIADKYSDGEYAYVTDG